MQILAVSLLAFLASPFFPALQDHFAANRAPTSAISFARTAMTPNAMATLAPSSVSVAAGFDGLNRKNGGAPGTGFVPPDVTVAAGPSHVMEMVNLARAVYDKQGSLLLRQNLSIFFGTGSDFVSDPKVLFDSQSQRWFATLLHCVGVSISSPGGCFQNPDRVEIAVSNSPDPTLSWRFYNVSPGTGVLPDQPIIGISDDKFVVSFNAYAASFLGAEWWVINKSDMIAGRTAHMQMFGPFPTLESVHPVQSLSSITTEYMVSTGAEDLGANSTTVKLFAITGLPGVSNTTTTPPNSLSLQNPITAPPFGQEPVPPCRTICSAEYYIATGDFRVQDAAWYMGGLWLDVNTDCKPNGSVEQACIRLVKINTAIPSIVQEFDYGAPGKDFYYGALRIDSMGSLGIIYGFSSPLVNPSLAVAGQALTDPAGSLTPSVTIAAGSTQETDTRYGDYFGAAVDPIDPTQVWVAGEYMNIATGACGMVYSTPTACWDTFITHFRERPVVSLNNLATFTGVSVTTIGSVVLNVPLGGILAISGSVSIVAKNSSSGVTVFSKNYTVANLALTNSSGTAPYIANFLLNVAVMPYALSSNVAITFSGASITSQPANQPGVTRNADINQDGTVNMPDTNIVQASFGCSIGSQCYNPRADMDANGTVDILDAATVAFWYGSPDYI